MHLETEIRPGRTLPNYWDVLVNRWAIAWIRLDRSVGKYFVKLTGKIQGDRDTLEFIPFASMDEAAQEATKIFRERMA